MIKTKFILCSAISTISILCLTSLSLAKDSISNIESKFKSQKINNKNVDQIKNIFDKKDKNNIFIDVRESFEWQEGTIPNALKISLGSISQSIDKLDKKKNYILVCRSGARSSKAYEIMQKAGFKNLVNFNGGMSNWYQKGYALNK